MNARHQLTVNDLEEALLKWDALFRGNVFVAACGGTALTLYGYKESTRDVDFLVPDPNHYVLILKVIKKLGYKSVTGNGFRHPSEPWIFDLFRGQMIFQTELLDPVQDEGRHRVKKQYQNLTVACINPDDLVISKMFRGTLVDVQDSVLIIKSELLDLSALAERYKETAGYYYNPQVCKKNLQYLITELELEQINAAPLKEMNEQWIP